MFPAAAVTALLVAKCTLGMSGLRSLRLEGGEQRVVMERGGVSGRKQNARADFLVYKNIPHFIRSYFKLYFVSS